VATQAGRPIRGWRASGVAFAVACAALASQCTSSSTEPSSSDDPNCKVQLAPIYLALSAGAQTANLKITVIPNSCGWQASSNAGFLTLSSTSGVGTTTVVMSLSANSGLSARTATISVGDQKATISQLAP